MTIKQDVDKLFKQGLSDFSEKPPSFVWDNIEQRLNKNRFKRKRNIIYSVAASIAILLSFGAGFLFTDVKSDNLAVESNVENIAIETQDDNTEAYKNIDSKEKDKLSSKNSTNKVKGKESSSLGKKKKKSNKPKSKKTKQRAKKINSAGTLLPPMFASSSEYKPQSYSANEQNSIEDSNGRVELLDKINRLEPELIFKSNTNTKELEKR